MRLSELQSKYIVNMQDGKNIGNIVDVKINEQTGMIESLIIEVSKGMFSFNRGLDESEIKWKSIAKIGEDVILVNISL